MALDESEMNWIQLEEEVEGLCVSVGMETLSTSMQGEAAAESSEATTISW